MNFWGGFRKFDLDQFEKLSHAFYCFLKFQRLCQGDEFVYRETWGEQLVERVTPVLCVVDVEHATVSLLENLPDSVSPGQVRLQVHGCESCSTGIRECK